MYVPVPRYVPIFILQIPIQYKGHTHEHLFTNFTFKLHLVIALNVQWTQESDFPH